MFESTLQAQALHEGERRFGTLSAAALAHLAFGLVIVAVTALIVPPVRTPDPRKELVIATGIPTADPTPRLLPPRLPRRGTDGAHRNAVIAPPRATPDARPHVPPEPTPIVPQSAALPESDRGGGGTPGDPTGSVVGDDGGTGDDRAGLPGGAAVDPVDVTGEMVRPVVLVKVDPSYPEAARRAGLGGRVTLRAVIAEDGRVESVEVFASTNPLFNDAAVDAVRRWRYRPALMNGRPVRVYFSVVVSFVVR
jgi:periplasmic protein TonB